MLGNSTISALALRCYGVTITFRSNSEQLLAAIDSDFIPAASPTYDTFDADLEYFLEANQRTGNYQASIGSSRLIGTSDQHSLIEAVKDHVHHTLAATAAQNLFLHAGAVAWHGKALLFPGRSHSGKSTLVRSLISAGAVYLSDEFAVLDENGFVHPFARPISLRTPAGRVRCRPSDIGGLVARHALPVGAIVFTRFSPRETFRPECLTAGRAVLEVLKHLVAIRAYPQRAIQMARAVTSRSLVIRSPRGDASSAAAEILNIVERSSAPEPLSDVLREEEILVPTRQKNGFNH
jgi:hypothetical protein